MTNKTSWEHVLPVNRFEMWIIRIAMTIALISSGFFGGITYATFHTSSNFQAGAVWMQKAYTSPGMVERVIITSRSTREKE